MSNIKVRGAEAKDVFKGIELTFDDKDVAKILRIEKKVDGLSEKVDEVSVKCDEVIRLLKKPVARLPYGVGDASLAEKSVLTEVCSEVTKSDQEDDEGSQ